jgi:hypothetical protein
VLKVKARVRRLLKNYSLPMLAPISPLPYAYPHTLQVRFCAPVYYGRMSFPCGTLHLCLVVNQDKSTVGSFDNGK